MNSAATGPLTVTQKSSRPEIKQEPGRSEPARPENGRTSARRESPRPTAETRPTENRQQARENMVASRPDLRIGDRSMDRDRRRDEV